MLFPNLSIYYAIMEFLEKEINIQGFKIYLETMVYSVYFKAH